MSAGGWPELLCVAGGGALGEGVPARDLYVSPDHGIAIDGLLINAIALVNGHSIYQVDAPLDGFTYYHVELENHALLFAEGAAAESYLPQNQERMSFENGSEYEDLYPHGSTLVCCGLWIILGLAVGIKFLAICARNWI